MQIESLLMRNFRNYQELNLTFSPTLNIFYGKNAQGKTNLLEALAYLGLGSSFRENVDTQLINWQQNFFYLQTAFTNRQGANTLSAGCDKVANRKLWKHNNVACKKLSEIVGLCHIVFFLPDDLQLVKRGPAYRRLFLDREMVQLLPNYHLQLSTYRKAMAQRNELLRGYRDTSEINLQLDVWEAKMAQAAAKIVLNRAELVEKLIPLAAELQQKISGGADSLEIAYDFSGKNELQARKVQLTELTEAELTEIFCQIWQKKRQEDARRNLTAVGPHRDDLEIKIAGKSARSFASQGQQRTAALALKLSEVELVKLYKDEYPILLLDDVLSELDAARKQSLLTLMAGKAQVFITTTDETLVLPYGKMFYIENGTVREQK